MVVSFANIGVVVDVVGESELIRANKTFKVIPKLELQEHDLIKTGKNAQVKLFFKDNTAVSLGQNTSFEIDSYLFTGEKDSNIKFKVLKGFFKTVTGQISEIAPERFELQTKNATIGIRGTVFASKVDDKADVVICTDGTVVLFTSKGFIEINKGEQSYAQFSKTPRVRTYTQKEKEALIKDAGWHGSMSIEELVAYIKANFDEPLRSQLLATIENILAKDSDSRESLQSKPKIKVANDVGFVDEITINGRAFDSLNQREIQFYPEDLDNGKVVVKGLLETLEKKVPVSSLHVEITTDGGESWSRANGNEEWEWSFEPQLEKNYEFSLRVVQEEQNQGDFSYASHDIQNFVQDEEQEKDIVLPEFLYIAGFKLYLNENTSILDGKISGSGTLTIPVLEHFGLSKVLNVNFENLSYYLDRITLGQIEYNEPITLNNSLLNLTLSSIKISAEEAFVAGDVAFKGSLGFLSNLSVSNTSKLLPNSLKLQVPVSERSVDIWSEKHVTLALNAGVIAVNFNQGDALPSIDASSLSAKLDFGDVLKQSQEGAKVVADVALDLSEYGESILSFPSVSKAYLFNTPFAIEGIDARLNLSNKSLHVSTSANLDDYTQDPMLQAMSGSRLDALISSTGFEASLVADGGLEPIVLLNRGGIGRDVRVSITGTPSIHMTFDGNDFDFGFGELSAQVDFGDVLQSVSNSANVQSVRASLKKASDDANEYALDFANKGVVYILGGKLGVDISLARFNLQEKSISFEGSADLSLYDNVVLKAIREATLSATINTSGLSASIVPKVAMEPIVLLQRGGRGKDVSMVFETAPILHVRLGLQDIDIGFEGGSAKVDFGDLLEGAKAKLTSLEENVYSWSIDGRKKLAQDAKLFLSNLVGNLDFSDLTNPNITFNANVDMSNYGGIVSTISSASLNDAKISKDGLSGAFSIALGSVPIWEAKGVRMEFLQNPMIRFALGQEGLDIGLSDLDVDLHFGSLLENASAHLSNLTPNIGKIEEDVSGLLTQTSQNFHWYINEKKQLLSSNLSFESLSGSLDISDFSNPSITLSARADLSQYADIFKYVRNAGLENAKISKNGLSGTLQARLQDIDIWKEKNVKVLFGKNKAVTLHLDVDSSGLKLGLGDVSASLSLGDLLENARAELKSVHDGLFSWSIRGKHAVSETSLMLQDLVGEVNLSDLKAPVINLNATADLSRYAIWLKELKSVALRGAVISKDGFEGSLSAELANLDIWQAKGVNVTFATPPTLNLAITRDDFSIGLSDIDASIHFGSLLDGEIVRLSNARNVARGFARGTLGKFEQAQSITSNLQSKLDSMQEIATKLSKTSCSYTWSLQNPHTLIEDSNGRVSVTSIDGKIDLCSLNDLSILFNAQADFSAYHFDLGNLAEVSVEGASISKNGIDWNNLSFSGASTEFTILDLGEKENDVRVELYNISGGVSSSGSGGVDGVDGTLYFGSLFQNVQPVTLRYNGSTNTYSFRTEQTFTYAKGDNSIALSNLSGTVQKIGENYKVFLEGDSQVHATLLSQIGVGNLNISNLGIDSSGLKGELLTSWDNRVISILGDKARLILNSVGVRIDTSLDIPIRLSTFDGYLDLSSVFDEASARALLSLVDSNVRWTLPNSLHVNENFIFKNLSGTLELGHLDSLALGMSGNLSYKGLDNLNLELQNFIISTTGISGSVGLGRGTRVSVPNIEGLNISEFAVNFGESISGNIKLIYDKEAFLGSSEALHVELSSHINQNGIQSFSLDSNALRAISIPNFATMAFSHVDVSPNFENFFINFDGTIQPTNALLSAANEVEFENLRISRTGISVDGAGVERDVNGASASLGGIGLSIEKVGIGFSNNKFYVSAKGGLSLVVTEAGAGVKLFSDGSLEVDRIKVLINNPALTFGGDIAWYSNDPIYGNGFGADGVGIKLVNMFSVSGRFKIGNHANHGFYWLAKAQGGLGSGIPLGPISIYELGGGAAYNMRYSGQDFIPSGGNNLIIILSSLLGTPDMGFTWHGNIDLDADTAGQIVMQGDTYILSPKEASPENRKISGRIIFGMAPASLQIAANANINYMSIGVRGSTDVLFNGSEKHVFIGTDSNAQGFNVSNDLGHVNVNIFGLNPWGYFMIDTRRLAFGAGYDFDKRLSLDVWGPDPYIRLVLGARADALLQYNPFFMDMSAEAHANLHVGYGDIFDGSLGAGINMRMRAPNPTYMKVKAYVDIPVYGNASFTTYFPSRPSGGSSDNLPTLINHVEPYEKGSISLMPKIKIVSTFDSDGSQFNVGNMEADGDFGGSSYSITQKLYFTANVENITLRDTATNQAIGLDKVFLASNEIELIPRRILLPNHTYRLEGTAKLIEYTQTTSAPFSGQAELMELAADPETYLNEHGTTNPVRARIIKTERLLEDFRVKAEAKLEFSEIVDYVSPENFQENVLENDPVVIFYDEIVKNLGANNSLIRNYRVEVLGADNKPISGSFYYEDGENPKSVFRPTNPMRIYHYCVNNLTGEIRETFLNANGQYLNPFNGYKVDGEESSQNASSVPTYISQHNVNNVNLGRYIKSYGDTYSYYTNANYGIIVTDTTTNQVVHFSSFTIKSNLFGEESLRRFDAMGDQLQPSLVYHRNLGRDYEMKFDIDNDLRRIGAYGGSVDCRLKIRWLVQKDGSSPEQTNTDTLCMQNVVNFQNFDKIIDIIDVNMIYINEDTHEELLTKPVDISEGGVYDTSGADRAHEEAIQNAGHVFDNGPRPSDMGNMGGSMGGFGGNIHIGEQLGAGMGEQFNLGAKF